MKKVFCIVIAMLMVFGLVACSAPAETEADSPTDEKAKTESGDTTETASNEGTSDTTQETTGETVYIGVVTYLTGAKKAQGDEAVKGADLAASQINANGGILGKQLEVVYFDGVDTQQAVVNAVKLALEDDRLSGLCVNCNSIDTLACLTYIQEAGMPTFVAGSAVSIMEAENPYIWQIRTLDSPTGVAMAKFVVEELGCKNPALWSITAESSIATKNEMKETLSGLGIDVPDNMIFSTTEEEQNYAPVAAQIKASGADCLIIHSTPPPIALLAKALDDANIDIPVIGNSGVANSACVESAGDAIEGWYVAAEFLASNDSDAVQNYVDAYVSEYGTDTSPDTATEAYTMAYFFANSCENANSTTDLELINEGISNIKDVDTPRGVGTFHGDHTPWNELYMAKMKDGATVYYSTVTYR